MQVSPKESRTWEMQGSWTKTAMNDCRKSSSTSHLRAVSHPQGLVPLLTKMLIPLGRFAPLKQFNKSTGSIWLPSSVSHWLLPLKRRESRKVRHEADPTFYLETTQSLNASLTVVWANEYHKRWVRTNMEAKFHYSKGCKWFKPLFDQDTAGRTKTAPLLWVSNCSISMRGDQIPTYLTIMVSSISL